LVELFLSQLILIKALKNQDILQKELIHSFRRYVINKMENKGLSPDWIDSRVGFKRNHTKAHYFTGTFLTDSNTTRTLANQKPNRWWRICSNNAVYSSIR
jgi:hypothetical protein